MSDHAETIRFYFHGRTSRESASEALDALLAERQQLQAAATALSCDVTRLAEARQQAIDALREPAKEKCCYDGMDCPDSWPTMPLHWCVPCFARAALVKLGEQP